MDQMTPTLTDLIDGAKRELRAAIEQGDDIASRNWVTTLGVLYDKLLNAPEAEQGRTPIRYSYHVEAFDAEGEKFRLDLLDGTSMNKALGAAEALYSTRPGTARVMLVIKPSDRPGWESHPVPRPPALPEQTAPTEPLFPERRGARLP